MISNHRKIIEDFNIKKKDVLKQPVSSFFLEEKKKINDDRKLKEVNKTQVLKRLSRDPQLPRKKNKSRKLFYIVFLIVLFLGIIFWGSHLFEKVSVTIVKKHEIFKLDKEVFTASKGLSSYIPFEIMIISDEKFEDITLTKNEEISLKSKGQVILYNEYSKNLEKLVANTYFSDEDGKVYLLDKNISIPGYTVKDNKIIPGEIVTTLTSFLPGESYNGKPNSFTINNYKNTPKFKKIYAKAKTDFTGGAIGLNYFLEEKDIENLKNIAESSFKDNLIKKVDSLIPPDYVFYKNAYNYTYKIDENIYSRTSNAKVGIYGILSVVLLKKDELKNAIIKNKIPKITDEELRVIKIDGIDKLILSFTEENQTIEKTLESISFSLTGQLDFIWNPDVNTLKNNLKGIHKENILEVFKKDVGVGNASIKIFPPWQKYIPEDEERIKIEVL